MLAVALHGELLEIGGEALEILLVGQHGHGLGAEEIVVPDGEQAHQHRQVALEGRGAEVLVHLMEAVQHGAEIVRPDGEHGREADGRIHGIAPADPIPEAEHVGRVDAELRHLLRVGGDGDEMLGGGGLLALEAGQQPVARGMRVGHGLERGEGLGGDDEQRLGGIEIVHRLGEVGAVDIGDEAEGHGPLAVVLQRFVGHDGAEIRSADADIDDIADALAGMPRPGASAQPIGEGRHLVEDGMDIGHHVLAVVQDGRAARRAQRDVKHRALFRDVDLVAAEHGVDALAQARLLGQLKQQFQGFVGDPVLGIVEIKPGGLDRHPLAALAVLGEELLEMDALDLLVVRLRATPRPGACAMPT